MNRGEFLKAALAVPTVLMIDHSLARAKEKQDLRDKRIRPFAASGSIMEMNKGDALLLWGSRIVAQGETYNNIIMGALAKNEIGSDTDVVNFDGFRLSGSADMQMIWLPKNSEDITKQIETLRDRMANKAQSLLVPQGSTRLVNGVIIELSQTDFKSPIRTYVHNPFYWSRN